ncbi:hypothetical protein [Adhaeretor mobilis]|uniref:PEP-CTERM protein-sorting domain-containing protein n=1 Tax=Adhaeretor mobilis TaxID=1930276 RepID=A0A517MTL9_9BACT|nr:hypothetical protein [Adhaeretor mobilis]QDS98235.1 hypothetical protein HG15A2_15080 [Adhaeretor mobilis]
MKKRNSKRANAPGVLLAIAVLASMAMPTSAAVLTFTDLPSWQAAVASSSLEDFEGATADDDFTFTAITSPNGDLGLSAVEESTFTINAFIDVADGLGNYESIGAGINGSAIVSMRFLSHTSTPPDSVTVTLPAGLSAFAFDYNNYDTQGDGAELSFAGTNGATGPVFSTGTGFYGVVDTGVGATISSFTLTGHDAGGAGTSAFMSFDDVRYGTAIPEPTSLALLSLFGLTVLGTRRR